MMAQLPTQSKNGYPTAGQQEVSVDDIMTKIYFMNEEQWKIDSVSGNFDYVVVGSSFCCLSFIQQMIGNKPDAKILVMDRGAYFHPEHFQNLPPAYTFTVGGQAETFHWRITEDTHNGEYIKFQHGMNNYFGGRSSFWSAWCPEPKDDEMEGWPAELKAKVHSYFPAAKGVLNVVPANEISSKESGADSHIFGALQQLVYKKLKPVPEKIATVSRIEYAPLAVGAKMYRYEDYNKFSASGPILNILIQKNQESKRNKTPQTLKVVMKCCVKKIVYDGRKAVILDTSLGDFTLGSAKLILAMGTLPPTTLMLNSSPFPELANIGARFTSHFISSIIARVPVTSITRKTNVFTAQKTEVEYTKVLQDNQGLLQMAAIYVPGKDTVTGAQFHIQLTAIIDDTPVENIYDTMRHLPDVVAAPSFQQLVSSHGYVVFVCACLGELDHTNSKNWYKKDNGEDITSNAVLQVVANDQDNSCWNAMDDTTFQVLEDYLTPGGDKTQIEYWSPELGNWNGVARPTKKERRVPGLVHEASTMWIGGDDDPTAPVGLDYKFRGVENVYLTGGSLWPTGGAWNPTCAMSAMAMDLADQLSKLAPTPPGKK